MVRRRRLLIVEDNEDALAIFKVMLQQLLPDYIILGAYDAAMAARLLTEEGPFHIIITDRLLPGESGLDLVQKVRSGGTEKPRKGTRRSVAVIVVTGCSGRPEDFEQRCNELHALYMEKPIDWSRLVNAIGAILR